MLYKENYEDKIYSLNKTVPGQTQDLSQAIQKTLENNGGVGMLTGYYDQNLSILSVSNLLLHSIGHTFDSFMKQTKGSLKNFFYGKDISILDRDRFLQIHGAGEAQILTADGTVNNVRLYKEDATDEAGRQIWIMSVQVNWDHVNLALINEAIRSGFWYFECDENSEIVNVNWSHEFRKMLGYHDTLDFPNNLETWERGIHPRDLEEVSRTFQEAFQDKTNEKKYDVEYRMRMADGTYQWFKDKGEVSRRADGTAFHMAGIFINIDAEKRARQYTQRVDAFHRAYTTANLCEYYVDLQENSFNSLKVEETLSGLFEESSTWDELIDLLLDFVRDENHAILISSHIVSDLEKLCDTIAFLHKGKLLLCEDKDTLREEYALWHGTAGQLEELDKNAIVSRRVTAYGAEALVKRELVPAGSTLTPVSIEELFVLMVKGENVR